VFNVLLQVLDDGRLIRFEKDGLWTFATTVLIMGTSEPGRRILQARSLKDEARIAPRRPTSVYEGAARANFRPEFFLPRGRRCDLRPSARSS